MLLLAGLLSAATVGGVAYWMVQHDFRQMVMDTAFENFRQDVEGYIGLYGSWENASRQEPFTDFVKRRRPFPGGSPVQPSVVPEKRLDRGNQPPFRFLLLSPDGKVIKGFEGYPEGSVVGKDVMQRARPVEVGGKIQALASPIGSPWLTPRDQSYLAAMRNSLFVGFAVAVVVAFLVGIVAGRRFSRAVKLVTQAVRAMKANANAVRVPVVSNDELGELAEEFNLMSDELARTHKELLELSVRDALTQLYNRRYFDLQANILLEQAIRYRQPLSVMVGDLDYFKQINDEFSHEIGDKVLKQVAGLLVAGTRRSDLVARYGGEEFVILFANTAAAQALTCCEQLRRGIESYPWHSLHPKLRVTMSMGVSGNISAGLVEKIIADADKALYEAKRAGRNRVLCAGTDDPSELCECMVHKQ